MRPQPFFSSGQTIVLRELWQGRVWSARPVILVQDKPEMLALYAPPGTMMKRPKTLGDERIKPRNRLRSEWILQDELWCDYFLLRMTIPESRYSVLIFWDSPDMSFHDWYINLEDPLRRTAIGFDYLDQLLDVIVKPDLSTWSWKDEDELEEAIVLGLLSKKRASAMRKEGEKVVRWLQSGQSPFNGWEKWRPNPSWKVPVLPEDWNKI
jgi:predicted RNA-binding protein associated with RNAse of E/G family